MAPKIKEPPKLTALPLLPQENLYVGSRYREVSDRLQASSHEPCWCAMNALKAVLPVSFDQSREGFRSFCRSPSRVCAARTGHGFCWNVIYWSLPPAFKTIPARSGYYGVPRACPKASGGYAQNR